ncbi:MAG TPA: sialate O-acetylesterase [Bacteroidales bacterium]|nr:sialate O-acetylesterase [Bacteroidales bacterium]
MKKLSFLILVLFLAPSVFGEVILPKIIGNNMVLQSNARVRIWGQANRGELVAVTIRDQIKKAKADRSGHWEVTLDPLMITGKSEEMKISGSNVLELKNILVGEVWVCSGQSNMEFPLGKGVSWRTGVFDYEQEVAEAQYPELRLFIVKNKKSEVPLTDCEGEWKVCTPESAKDFSAVGYYFGRSLLLNLRKPVGLIQSAVGGTHAELWTKMEVMTNQSLYKEVFEEYDLNLKKFDEPGSKVAKPSKPACLWNGMIVPLLPFTIKGVIWYQGESNDGRAKAYRQVFNNLINSWRKEWKQGAFPFYFVQIAAHRDKTPALRNAQALTWNQVKNTGMVVAIDAGDSVNIHPRNKTIIGERLANWALAKDYGLKDRVYSGPVYKSSKKVGNSIQLSFYHTEGGLVAKDGGLREFMIAGKDHHFYPAIATIHQDKILVTSVQVPHPEFVRYAWSNYMHPNFYNGKGLPAAPFKTDK